MPCAKQAGGAPGEQPRRLELGLHVHQVALDRGQLVGRGVVAHADALALELLAARSRAAARPTPTAMAATIGRLASKVAIAPLKPLSPVWLGSALLHLLAAEQVVARDAAVLEAERRRVGGADAELLLEADERHARRARRHDERLDAAAAGALVDGGPHHDEAARHLRTRPSPAVQKILVPFSTHSSPSSCGRRLDRGGVAAGVRLGDRHRAPDRVAVALEGRQEAQLLLVRARGGHRGAAERRGRHAQVERGVAPAQLLGLHADLDEAVALAVGAPGAAASLLPVPVHPLLAADRARDRRTSARSAASARAPPCGSALRPPACSPPSGTRSAWLPQTSARASKLAKPRAFRSCISGRYSRV